MEESHNKIGEKVNSTTPTRLRCSPTLAPLHRSRIPVKRNETSDKAAKNYSTQLKGIQNRFEPLLGTANSGRRPAETHFNYSTRKGEF